MVRFRNNVHVTEILLGESVVAKDVRYASEHPVSGLKVCVD